MLLSRSTTSSSSGAPTSSRSPKSTSDRTAYSVSPSMSSAILPKVARNPSVNTNTPTVNITPRVTAEQVSRKRKGLPEMLRRISLKIISGAASSGREPARRSGRAVRRRPCRRPGRSPGLRNAAARGSWVTMTMVWPRLSTASRMNCRISLPDVESRLPVGSSAKMISGRLARARLTATRCCCPPDNSLGRWLIRSAKPTVFMTWSSHASSGSFPARSMGRVMFSSAERVGTRLKA